MQVTAHMKAACHGADLANEERAEVEQRLQATLQTIQSIKVPPLCTSWRARISEICTITSNQDNQPQDSCCIRSSP